MPELKNFSRRITLANLRLQSVTEQAKSELVNGGVSTHTRYSLIDAIAGLGLRLDQMKHAQRNVARNLPGCWNFLAIRYNNGNFQARPVIKNREEEERIFKMLRCK